MHGALIRSTIGIAILISLAGCQTGGNRMAAHSDDEVPTNRGGIFSSFAKQMRGSRNQNARPTHAKPAGARTPKRSKRSEDASDSPSSESSRDKVTGTELDPEIEGLLGAFEDASPEVQAYAKRLAKAKSMQQQQSTQDQASTESTKSTMAKPLGEINLPGTTQGQSISLATATAPVTDDSEDGEIQQAVATAADRSKGEVAFAVPDATQSTEQSPGEKTHTVQLDHESTESGFEQLSEAEQLDAMIKGITSQAIIPVDTPEGLRRAMQLRLLYLMSGKLDEALTPVDGLSQAEQEYFRHQLMTIWNVIDPSGPPNRPRRWNTTIENLMLASSHLAAATESLDVSAMAFCTEVESFGRIVPFDEYKFHPGQQVILYCELDHFAAERLSDGYETHFQGSYDVFDAEGVRVADQVLPADKQSCNNFRRDYFIAYRLYLPKQLKPGPHRVQLTIEDLKGKKYGQSVLDFDVIEKRPESQ